MAKKDGITGELFGRSISRAIELLFKQGVIVTGLKVKYPGIDPLIVVTARTTEGPKIAFVGGADMDKAGAALCKLVQAGELRWREDEWQIKKMDTTED